MCMQPSCHFLANGLWKENYFSLWRSITWTNTASSSQDLMSTILPQSCGPVNTCSTRHRILWKNHVKLECQMCFVTVLQPNPKQQESSAQLPERVENWYTRKASIYQDRSQTVPSYIKPKFTRIIEIREHIGEKKVKCLFVFLHSWNNIRLSLSWEHFSPVLFSSDFLLSSQTVTILMMIMMMMRKKNAQIIR